LVLLGVLVLVLAVLAVLADAVGLVVAQGVQDPMDLS